jgi:hypothetical protein
MDATCRSDHSWVRPTCRRLISGLSTFVSRPTGQSRALFTLSLVEPPAAYKLAVTGSGENMTRCGCMTMAFPRWRCIVCLVDWDRKEEASCQLASRTSGFHLTSFSQGSYITFIHLLSKNIQGLQRLIVLLCLTISHSTILHLLLSIPDTSYSLYLTPSTL